MEDKKLVEVQNLKQYFPVAGGKMFEKKVVKAVDNVSFFLNKGETLGLVGESGAERRPRAVPFCASMNRPAAGSSMMARQYLTAATCRFTGRRKAPDGRWKTGVRKKTAVNMLPYRRKMQIVFQDPYASLDPRMTVGDIVGEAIDIHKLASGKQDRQDKIIEMLRRVGLNSEHANRYPHEFSGGQRRVSALPVHWLSIRNSSCVMSRFRLWTYLSRHRWSICSKSFRSRWALTYLFIAHDLSIVKHISNRIGVMYLEIWWSWPTAMN